MANRAEFQRLADEWIVDAEALLNAGRWSAAFYLAGYAVECALKACVLAYVAKNPDIIFKEKRFSDSCWTHDVESLLRLADLGNARDAQSTVSAAFGLNWQTAKDWDPEIRYLGATEIAARKLFAAITDPVDGVLQWIKSHW